MNDMFVQPTAVWVLRSNSLLYLFVGHNPPLGQIDEQQLSRFQTTPLQNFLFRNVQHTGLRSKNDAIVVGQGVPTWTEPIAVEHRAHLRSVAERKSCRPIPRLHQGAVVLVKSL